MRRRKQKRGKSKLISKIWKIGIGVLILFLTADAYLFVNSRFFNIKSVDVFLDKVGCTNENTIKNETSLFGKNFFLINAKSLEKQIKDKYFCIKLVNLSKTFPNKIKILVSGREAVAILASDSASLANDSETTDQFLVDSEGILFARPQGENVPRIYLWADQLTLGKKIEVKIIGNSLIILEKIKSFGVNVKDARIYSKDNLIINPETEMPHIYFSLGKDIEVQLASLQLILTQAKIEMQEMEFIDLQYDKPVVKYAPKKE